MLKIVQRLNEIHEEKSQLLLKLAPAYAAIDLLATEENHLDVTLIESHPVFAPLWRKMQDLDLEMMRLHMSVLTGA